MEIESSGGDFVQTTVCVHKSALSSAQPHSGSRQAVFVGGIYLRFTAHLCSPEWSVIAAIINLLCWQWLQLQLLLGLFASIFRLQSDCVWVCIGQRLVAVVEHHPPMGAMKRLRCADTIWWQADCLWLGLGADCTHCTAIQLCAKANRFLCLSLIRLTLLKLISSALLLLLLSFPLPLCFALEAAK